MKAVDKLRMDELLKIKAIVLNEQINIDKKSVSDDDKPIHVRNP